MNMNNIVLDPRLVGLTTTKITKKFVTNALNAMELDEPCFIMEARYQTKSWSAQVIRSADPIALLQEVMDFIKKLETKHTLSMYHYGINVQYEVLVRKSVDPVTYYMAKWKKDIQEYKEAEKEYQQYLALKQKYGE